MRGVPVAAAVKHLKGANSRRLRQAFPLEQVSTAKIVSCTRDRHRPGRRFIDRLVFAAGAVRVPLPR
jgi:hypothetical protein